YSCRRGDDEQGDEIGRASCRERVEISVVAVWLKKKKHRTNATCNSCHRFMDPISLALDDFDVSGKSRQKENCALIDTHGSYNDGTPVSNLTELINALTKRPTPLVRTFTENLMAYALGRFFFQAEDGIRHWSVTGVQTCALPISYSCRRGDDEQGD